MSKKQAPRQMKSFLKIKGVHLSLISKIKEKLVHLFSSYFQSFDIEKWLKKIRHFLSKHFKMIITLLIALAIADLIILFLWPMVLPDESLVGSRKIQKNNPVSKLTSSGVNFINRKNIFHRGRIPEKESDNFETNVDPLSAKLTSLTLKLLGTIESSNPKKSMASIFNTTDQKSDSYFVGDVVDKKAEIRSIERRKVIFMNLLNNQLEYLEIPLEDNNPLKISDKEIVQALTPPSLEEEKKKKPISYEGISVIGENKFSLYRSALNDHLQKLPDILQQAKVVPKKDENNQVIGHTFSWIKKGSVFEGLGFEKGDTLVSINDEKVSNEMEAAELFKRLRSSSNLVVIVENKDGQTREVLYNVEEDTSIN